MSGQKGRDFLLKIGDGGAPEQFVTIGAARAVAMALDNKPVESTSMGSGGIQTFMAEAGVQSLQISLEGLFKDSAAEELLRATAFERSLKNYHLCYPNGDVYAAGFVVLSYTRQGSYDGLEMFSAALARSGAGTFTPAPPPEA